LIILTKILHNFTPILENFTPILEKTMKLIFRLSIAILALYAPSQAYVTIENRTENDIWVTPTFSFNEGRPQAVTVIEPRKKHKLSAQCLIGLDVAIDFSQRRQSVPEDLIKKVVLAGAKEPRATPTFYGELKGLTIIVAKNANTGELTFTTDESQ
jgi:hypothetical protein